MATRRTKSRLAGELSHFVQKYARKAGIAEPNDRQYDRKIEQKMKQIPPVDLSYLLSDDLDDPDQPDNESMLE
jgi:hypothetical protein